MQKFLTYILDAVILVLLSLVGTSCEEQSEVQLPNVEQLTIRLTYDQTENLFSNARITPQEITEKDEQLTGEELMRVILRAYPIERGKRATDYTFEKTLTRRSLARDAPSFAATKPTEISAATPSSDTNSMIKPV